MPFLFWWNTWFGRHLSDNKLAEYLHDDKKPRHIQQRWCSGERMNKKDSGALQWYPQVVQLAAYPVEKFATPTRGSWGRTRRRWLSPSAP